MKGVTEIDNKLFVVFANSSKLEVYDAETFSRLSVARVEGLRDPRDIVVCRTDRQLYIGDEDCIWRVSSTDPHQYEKWLPSGSTNHRLNISPISGLSLTSQRLVVT